MNCAGMVSHVTGCDNCCQIAAFCLLLIFALASIAHSVERHIVSEESV
jgi:hypothetical protein